MDHRRGGRANPRMLALLSLGHLVTDINQGALPVLLPSLRSTFHLSYTMVGVIVTISTVSSSVIQPLFGFWSDRLRTPWLLPLGVFMAGAGMALAGISPSYPLLLLAVLLSGLGVASYHPEASKAAFYHSGRRRVASMSIFSVGGNLGFGIGPLLMSFLLTLFGIRGTLWLLFPGALMGAFLWRILPHVYGESWDPGESSQGNGSSRSLVLRELTRGPILLLVTVVILRSWAHMGLVSFIPLYSVSYLRGSTTYAGSLLTLFLISGALGTLVGSPLADWLGRKAVFVGSMLLLTPLLILFPYSQGLWTLLLTASAGFVIVSTFATTIVWGQELLPQYPGVASGLIIGFAIGMGGLGVTILGRIADLIGLFNTFRVISFLPLLTVPVALFLPEPHRGGGAARHS